jgi:hypothetical protein
LVAGLLKATMYSLLFSLSSQISTYNCLETWMYGEKYGNFMGTYGKIRVPNPSNICKARYEATNSYNKKSVTLWLFGDQTIDSIFNHIP